MEEKEIHLRDYWRVIQKRRSIVITFALLTFVMVLIGTLTATPRYTASAKILVEKNEANPLGKYYYYASQDPEFIETQSQIITSKRVARKVVGILELEKNYKGYFPEESERPGLLKAAVGMARGLIADMAGGLTAGKKPASPTGADDGGGEDNPQDAWLVNLIRDDITVTPVKESRVFNISFTSANPILAARVANTLAKAYMEELIEIKMSSSNDKIRWMSQKAGEERAKLEAAETELQKYSRGNDIVTIEDKITVVPQKLAEFSSQLSKAEARRKELEAIYQQTREAAGGKSLAALEAIPVIAEDKAIQTIRDQVLQAQQKITELGNKLGPKHPLMVKAESELEGLLAKKKEEINRAIDSIKNQYELTRANEDNLRNLLAATKAEAMGLNEKFMQYEALKRDVDSNRAIYEALFSHLKEQDVTEESKTVDVWMVEKAEVPESPAKPNRPRNILLGLVLGLFGGVGLAFFAEYLDNTVKSPEDAEERLGLPMLGVIELLKAGKGQQEAAPELVCLQGGHSAIAESFKTLRTSVLFAAAPENRPKSIIVTGMLPGEGKTTTAVNLAITIAQAGQRVLLIDGDIRKPRLHKLFNLDNRQGLSSYLAGVDSVPASFPGPLANLTVIPSGPLPPNPSELLSSNRLQELLDLERPRHDIIIFDSAPVISVTDTLIISKAVDGVIVVARAAETTYDAITKGVKSMADIKARVLGMVINAFDTKHYQYYYGKYYYRSYQKYYASEES